MWSADSGHTKITIGTFLSSQFRINSPVFIRIVVSPISPAAATFLFTAALIVRFVGSSAVEKPAKFFV